MHLKQVTNIDMQSVAQMFIKKYPQKLFGKSVLFED